ncbi:hypothetical protein DEU56DRAFT_758132, partial [Suillus clintonianus]|uniref:uncharacterized protein n=1 Tax=Suillus clintonianus TaxID=1904413 RepID=UPI001B881650
MNTDLHASYLSLSEDGKPTPSEAKESTFVTHDKTSKSRTSRKHFPYPPNPAPLELRYAARMMKSKFQPEFSLEATQKFQEQLESGLSQMTTATLYKGYKAKLASREVARQRMVLATWEIDEAAQYEEFLIAIYGENEQRKYLQAVFEDECEILRVASAQTDQVATLLNSRVKHAFLKPAAAFPLHPNGGLSCIGTREPSEHSDPDLSDGSYADLPPDDSDHDSEDSGEGAGSRFRLNSPYKSLILACSGICGYLYYPIATFNRPTDMLIQSMQPPDDNEYPHFPGQLQDRFSLSDYADRNPNLNDQLEADDEGDPLSRFLRMTDPQYATTTSSLKSLTSEMDAPPPTPSSSTLEPLDAGDGVYPYATTNSLQLLTPRWMLHPPRHLAPANHLMPVMTSTLVLRPPEPTAPMAALAIPSTIAAPVASRPSTLVPLSLKFVAMQPGITASGVAPAAPAIFPGPAAVQPTTPALINVNSLVKKQILNSAKRRILRFFLTASAMAGTDGERAALVSRDFRVVMPGMNVTIRTTSSERQQVTAAWNGCFRKLLDMVRSCLALGYTFYPPLESNLQPVQFRGRVITALINDTFTVDASGHVTILDGVLDNPLIFHVAVQFIWCSDLGISQFLSTSALHRHQQLNYAFGAIGAAVKLALREQIPHPPVILPFTQHEGSETFEDIVRYIGNMDGVQRIAFDYRKSHMLSIGDSQ